MKFRLHKRRALGALTYLARHKVGLTLGAAMAINQLGIIGAPLHDFTSGYAALWACAGAALAIAYALTGVRRET